MKAFGFLLVFLATASTLNAQKAREPMIIVPEGSITYMERAFSVKSYQLSRYELTAGTAAELLNTALESEDFVYPPDRNGQIRLKATGKVLVDLSHKSSPLIYRNRTVEVRSGKENFPLVCVSRWGAMFLCNLLSERDHLQPCYDLYTGACAWHHNGYRLPTLAEWLRARQINHPALSRQTLTEDAWFFSNFPEPGHSGFADNYTHPVGTRRSGALGLYDLLGNVGEWCWDFVWLSSEDQQNENPRGPESGSLNYVLGGSWESDSEQLLSPLPLQVTDSWAVTSRIGFRVARTPGGQPR